MSYRVGEVAGAAMVCFALLLTITRFAVAWFHRLTWRDRDPVPMPHVEQELTQALARLTQKGGRPYVIVEDRRSERSVQFCGSKSEPLILDLPMGQFASPVADVAHLKSILGGDACVSVATEVFPTFMRPCDSPGDAAKLAVRILREVYGLTDDDTVLLTEAA